MEWLTKEYVWQQADKNLHAAVDVTIEHWTQLCEATKEELLEMRESMITSSFCGLCMFFRKDDSCNRCLLAVLGLNCSGYNSPWMKAYHAYCEMKQPLTVTEDRTLKKFKKRAKKLLKILKSLKKCNNKHLFKCKG